jgi:hypothetical protein
MKTTTNILTRIMAKTEDWTYQSKEVPQEIMEENVGFVYLITNLESNRKYIGQKLFRFTRRKIVKGKKNRKKVVKESDWRDYFGSSQALQNDVEKLGSGRFSREILRLCKSKGEMNYWETKLQFDNEVLLSEDWYNNFIGCRINGNKLKL